MNSSFSGAFGIKVVFWGQVFLLLLYVLPHLLITIHPSQYEFSMVKLSALNRVKGQATSRAHMTALRELFRGKKILTVPILFPFLDTAVLYPMHLKDSQNLPDYVIEPYEHWHKDWVEELEKEWVVDFLFEGQNYKVYKVIH